jgi:hypothetical protein
VGDEREPDRTVQDDDEQALEEIRQLFARYRRIARHGMVTERDDRAVPLSREGDANAVPGTSRSRGRS